MICNICISNSKHHTASKVIKLSIFLCHNSMVYVEDLGLNTEFNT